VPEFPQQVSLTPLLRSFEWRIPAQLIAFMGDLRGQQTAPKPPPNKLSQRVTFGAETMADYAELLF